MGHRYAEGLRPIGQKEDPGSGRAMGEYMDMQTEKHLSEICRQFRIEGELEEAIRIPVGNVNQTYQAICRMNDGKRKSFIVQRLNTFVFKHPREVMQNIDLITEHIRAKKPDGVPLHFHHTEDRKTYVEDEEGFWRLYNYIPSVTYDTCENPEVLKNAGEAFGRFQRSLADFDASVLYETIPDFHNTPARFRTLFEDARRDPLHRADSVREELSYLASVRELAGQLAGLQAAGELPLRVTHNDTKINNVLFHPETNEALTIIDLDTVMPGLVAHDFGDAIRFAANNVAEDSKDYANAGLNLELFSAFTEGFLSQTGDSLTERELETLPLGVFTLTAELAARFLDDYLLGNVYFRTEYPEHNLVRTRCQINMAKDVYRKLDQMKEIIRR